jgi:GntR family transcriptional regulator
MEGGGMPLHRQLYLVLRDQISRGAIGVGQGLPTEHSLGEQFGVSRITVRRALQDLADQGYVERRHGRGTFVLDRPQTAAPSPTLTVMDGLRKAALETKAEVLELASRKPPPSIADALGLEEGARALYVLRLRRDKSSREPLMVTEGWLPSRFADVVNKRALASRALFEILAAGGVAMGRVVQELTAEIADPIKAQLLGTSIGSAILRVNRLVFDRDGEPVEHLSLFLSPERSRILADIPAEDIDSVSSGFIAHDVPRS